MYIVIENFPDPAYAAIVTNEDGANKVFDTSAQAQTEADDCQNGIIIEL
jgi:hypothetical protein